ncbi:hypothetical protein ACGFYT_01235 [Streptomyces sp. NPDC048208]|uniref:hypothetical protein n=1 Tax=Streptomyces sp. NPDC048208 TaxID=3365515 RepID=UPI00371D876B
MAQVRVNPFQVLAACAADWSRYGRLLDAASREAVRATLAELRCAGANQEATAERAARTLVGALPAEVAAELVREEEPGRFAGAPSAILHEGYGATDLCMLVLDGNPMVGPVLGAIRKRLLSAPAEPWSESADPRLIVLSDEDGRRRLPAFQFEAGTMPWQIVLEIGTVLRADLDPWGAADWWLSGTTWWDGTPADLLGHGRDAEMLGAARALVTADEEA